MINIIAAVDRNLGIGFQNKLLFWLPNDLKTFQGIDHREHHHHGKKNI